jgi:two-component system, response regulator YesN
MNKKLSTLFWRYLVLYVFVLLVPVLILGTFAQTFLIRQLRKSAIERTRGVLEQQSQLMDEVFIGAENIVYQLWQSPELQPFQYEDQPYEARTAMNTIRRFRNTSRFVENIGLQFRNDTYVYGATGVMTNEDFFSATPSLKDLTYPGFLLLMRHINDREFVYKDGILTIFLPYPQETLVQRRIFIVTLNLSKIAESFLDQRLVGASVDAGWAERFWLLERQESWKDSELLPFTFYSDSMDWTYSFLMPLSTISEEISGVTKSFLLTVSITFIFGLLLVVFLSYHNYVPIRDLKDLISQLYDSDDLKADDISLIKKGVNSITLRDQQLSKQLKNSTPAIRESVTLRLLNGGIIEPETLKSLGIFLDGANIRVLIIYVSDIGEKDSGQLELLRDDLHNYICVDDCDLEAVVLGRQRIAIMLMCLKNCSTSSEKIITNLHEIVAKRFNTVVTIGVGNEKSHMKEIAESYIEAANALDYRLVLGLGSIIYFNEAREPAASNFPYPFEHLEKFERLLLTRDSEGIRHEAEIISDLVVTKNPPLIIARRLYYHVLSLLWSEFRDLGSPNGDVHEMDLIPGTLVIERIDRIDEVMGLMCKTVQQFLGFVLQIGEVLPDSITSLKTYIELHFQDTQLSLVSLADHFGQSPNYLSAAFKKTYQLNLSDYISNLRIDMARQLLEQTDMKINEIVTEVLTF